MNPSFHCNNVQQIAFFSHVHWHVGNLQLDDAFNLEFWLVNIGTSRKESTG